MSILFPFILVLFLIGIIALWMVSIVVGGVLNLWYMLTGKYPGSSRFHSTRERQQRYRSSKDKRKEEQKIFADDEGTYVEFEEVKE